MFIRWQEGLAVAHTMVVDSDYLFMGHSVERLVRFKLRVLLALGFCCKPWSSKLRGSVQPYQAVVLGSGKKNDLSHVLIFARDRMRTFAVVKLLEIPDAGSVGEKLRKHTHPGEKPWNNCCSGGQMKFSESWGSFVVVSKNEPPEGINELVFLAPYGISRVLLLLRLLLFHATFPFFRIG